MSGDLEALAARLVPHLDIVRPHGPGPFPVVVQMHGCGGVQPLQRRYAQVALDAGVAAVVVDSLAPRGLSRAGKRSRVAAPSRRFPPMKVCRRPSSSGWDVLD